MGITEEFGDRPKRTDFHGRKRELLKRGMEEGELSWAEIRASLPEEFLTSTELEVLLFTCKNLGIEVTGQPGR